jgi:hypothetical protein
MRPSSERSFSPLSITEKILVVPLAIVTIAYAEANALSMPPIKSEEAIAASPNHVHSAALCDNPLEHTDSKTGITLAFAAGKITAKCVDMP